MVSLEQIKLLESKVSKAVDYVKKVTDENTQLKGRLDSYQNRIDELEALIQQFRQDQSRIEEGILSALDRLNQFEDALEGKLSSESLLSAGSLPAAENVLPAESLPAAEDKLSGRPRTAAEPAKTAQGKKAPEPAAHVPAVHTPAVTPAAAPPAQHEEKNPEDSGAELDIF